MSFSFRARAAFWMKTPTRMSTCRRPYKIFSNTSGVLHHFCLKKGEYFEEKYGALDEKNLNQTIGYSMHPLVLDDQLEKSLANLNVKTLDCYYINLPEVLLKSLSHEEFIDQLVNAFKFLETRIEANKIKSYGITCWNIGRKLPYSKFHFNFNKIMDQLNIQVGKAHSFRCVQIPLSVGMPENFCEKYCTSPESGGKFFAKINENRSSFLPLSAARVGY